MGGRNQISEYQDPGIEDLSYADRDAEAFADFLISPRAGLGGIDQGHIRLLTNQDATAPQLRTALFDFLQQPGPDDLVIFFFAGHGMPSPGRPLGTQFLIPADGDRTNFAGSAIRMGEVESALYDTKAQVVLIVDACHSGAIGAAGARGDEVNRFNSIFAQRIAAARPSGVSMILAAHEGEIAHEGDQWGGGHGVFTYHLLEALNGRGDRDNDGIVDLGEAYDYVRVRVAEDTDNQQNPYANESLLRRDLPMSLVPGALSFDEQAVPASPSPRDEPTLDIFATTDLVQQDWFAHDSVVGFVGVRDTLEVRLGSASGRRAPPTRLRWVSSSPNVATVDRFGVIEPHEPGVTRITASVFTKDVQILVRVYPTPEEVAFAPAGDEVTVTQFDEIRFAGVVELASGETIAGILPNLTVGDTSVIAPRGNGRYQALREGNVTVEGSLGAARQQWSIHVLPPRLKIDHDDYGALRFADTISLVASYARPDGTPITQASGVTWKSSDTTVIRATTDGLVSSGWDVRPSGHP